MLGLQIYTVRDKMCDAESALATIQAVKDIGYECIQLAGSFDQMAIAADACVNVGIPVVGILTSLKTIHEQGLPRLIELAQGCGATDIGISAYSMTEEWEARELIRESNELAAVLSECGISFSYHNHSNEFIKCSDGRTIMQMMKDDFTPAVDFMPDTYWLQHGGADVRAFLEEIAGHVKILHLKDMKRVKDGPIFSELGEGNMNFPGIVEVARSIGVRHYIVEQDVCEGDSMESARISYNYIKSIL